MTALITLTVIMLVLAPIVGFRKEIKHHLQMRKDRQRYDRYDPYNRNF